jgi:hypothetical protein
MHERRRLRWHWQESCDVDRNVPLEVLHEWADEFGIQSHDPDTQLLKTKRALCADLAQWWEAQNEAQQAVISRCENDTCLWTGDRVAEIPSEFFYPYTHDDKIYCEDIRSLHKHVNLSQSPQNPYNRQHYSPELVEDINTSYDRLQRRAVHMDDFDDDHLANAPLQFEARFSQKLADLMSHLFHPVGPERLRESSADEWDGFLEALFDEGVLSDRQLDQVDAQPDLDHQKFFLVELLVIKIDNDPHHIDTPQGILSQIAVSVTNVYNKFFGE